MDKSTLMAGILFLYINSADAAQQTLSVSVTINQPTCDLSIVSGASGGIINFGSVKVSEFANQDTLAYQKLTLGIKNCAGADGGSSKPAIVVTGEHEGISDISLFRSGASTSGGIGFRLGYGNTFVSDATVPFYQNISDDSATVPTAQNIDFLLALSRGNLNYLNIHSGLVQAKLHFEFVWH